MAWTGRELRKPDMKALTPLVERAPRTSGFFVKAALARGDDFKGWWYGAFRDGQSLEAVMAVDNHQGSIYADNEEAARGFAEELFGMQKRLGAGQPRRHQLIGEARTMAIIWPIMKDLPGRKLVFDKTCDLMQAAVDDTPASSSRVLFDLAKGPDERVVYDFIGDLCVEQHGFDPRKVSRDAHIQHVGELIVRGHALVAKEKETARPYFVGELVPMSDTAMLLGDTFVPPHFRTRGKILAQAFWATARHPSVHGKDLVYLSSDPIMTTATKAAGWTRMASYRWTITYG